MQPSFSPADEELLERFEHRAIPRPEWTHRAHVQVAYLYGISLPFPDALSKIRNGIKALNAANGVEETPTMGYHETITVAFATLVAAVARAYHGNYPPSSDEFCDKHPELLSSKLFKLFFSPELLSNPLAKTKFLEPDLAQLPRI